MQIFSADETAQRLPYPALIEQMEALYAAGQRAPVRHHHTMAMQGEPDATLLLMPAWSTDIGCVKIVTVLPGNAARGLAAVAGSVLVFDRANGAHLALLDGTVLTAMRTAAASALAARHLAPKNARNLLILGSGRVASELPAAFGAVRDIEKVRVWNVNPASARRLAESLAKKGWDAEWAPDLGSAVAEADIVSAATLATEPILKGEWLHEGQHVDLIGAFTLTMREADDLALQRASIFIDTPAAMHEAGELQTPLETGAISESDIRGDLYDLATGKAGRSSPSEITLFKSVGNAVLDLAAAITALK